MPLGPTRLIVLADHVGGGQYGRMAGADYLRWQDKDPASALEYSLDVAGALDDTTDAPTLATVMITPFGSAFDLVLETVGIRGTIIVCRFAGGLPGMWYAVRVGWQSTISGRNDGREIALRINTGAAQHGATFGSAATITSATTIDPYGRT